MRDLIKVTVIDSPFDQRYWTVAVMRSTAAAAPAAAAAAAAAAAY